MKVMNTTTFLTRKCNLSCSYCRIKDNHFPDELNIDCWKEAFSILKDVGINVLMGGEPMLTKHLPELIRHLETNSIPYALSTNGTIWKRELVDSGLSNWSISYDGETNNADVNAKSKHGLESLGLANMWDIKDRHATITVTKENLLQLPTIVENFDKMGVWSEITALHWKKNKYYDFAAPRSEMEGLVFENEDRGMVDQITRTLWLMKDKGYKIHNERQYFAVFENFALQLSWRCGDYPYSLSIDADGKLRTCLHIAGSKKFSVFDLPEKWDDFVEQWKKDKEKMCEGCFWDCFWQAEYWAKKDFEAGKRGFRHE